MLKFKLVIVVSFSVLLLALAGCRGMVAPPEATTLTVMTYNIYVGTEVAGIFTLADPALVPGEISKMYGNIVASDFPGRGQPRSPNPSRRLSRTSSGCRKCR